MELKDIKRVHLIGIAGVSMAGLAKVLEVRGIEVNGCDLTAGGHDPGHITKDLDLVVISQAITEQSPGFAEVETAQKLNIPVQTRAWLIGRLMQEKGKIGVAIAGAHGKTTTTAMLGMILLEAGLDPTILNGGVIKQLGASPAPDGAGASWRVGKGPHIVAEACEYEKQFLQFVPRAVILTNIDKEHLDTFPKGLPQIIRAFRDFVKLIPKNGILVINGDDPNLRAVAKSCRCRVKAVSFKRPWPGLRLKLPGEHNLMAANLAAHLAHELGVAHEAAKSALNKFQGVARRLDYLGEKNGVKVYDDYGHHPAELATTFRTLRELHPKSRLIVAFQPHQAKRTKLLFDDFVKALKIPAMVLIAPIFKVAGRDENESVSSEDLAKAVGQSAKSYQDYQSIAASLKKIVQRGDVVLTIGATKVNEAGKQFLSIK